MSRARVAALVLGALGLAAAGGAGEIPKAVVVLEAFEETFPGQVPEAAPPRFVLLEDGQVFVGGSGRLVTAKLPGSELKALDRRLSDARKLPGLSGTVSLGPGEQRHRMLLRKGRPIDMTITGDPARADGPLRPLASLILDLPRFHHHSLRPYQPQQYALRAREGTLAGGCRAWPFPEPPTSALFAPQVVPADQVRGWPTGAWPAAVCAGDKAFVVTFRPLLPGETP